MSFLIYNCDVFDGLRKIPDNSIQCIVTSPPYFNLRDYQTASWEGGNHECNHKIPENEHDPKRGNREETSSHIIRFNRECCHICGAKRVDKQIGLESSPKEYVSKLVEVFAECYRVLKDNGTLWLNLGDSYGTFGGDIFTGFNERYSNTGINGKQNDIGNNVISVSSKTKFKNNRPKNLLGIPWRVAFALQDFGWNLRQDIIWKKPNPLPESVKDRCTKSHEYIFLLTKSTKYYFDHKAIQEPAAYNGRKDTRMKGSKKYKQSVVPNQTSHTMASNGHERWKTNDKGEYVRNKRSVWSVPTKPNKVAHFATFPKELIKPCILAGSNEGDTVLDPFNGSGTTGIVSLEYKRNYVGIELNPEYYQLSMDILNKLEQEVKVEQQCWSWITKGHSR